MSRLIDANALIKEIHMLYSDDLGIREVIDKQPTAYDPDKVVEQLKIEKSTANNTYIAYEMKVDLGRVFGLEKAIEIVKGGGVYA